MCTESDLPHAHNEVAPPVDRGRKQVANKKPRKARGESTRFRDYLHQRIGNLVIVAKGPTNTGLSRNAPAIWVACCDCGNLRHVTAKQIKKKECVTCGEKGCPFRAVRATRNLQNTTKAQDLIASKCVWQGFKLSAYEVKKILASNCILCGHQGPLGHELRTYDPHNSYNVKNTYTLCNECKGLVPLGNGHHKPWDKLIAHLKAIVGYQACLGNVDFDGATVIIDRPTVDADSEWAVPC